MSGWADPRLAALRRFAIAITLFNVLGHTVFGFEQSWAQPLVGIGTAYLLELLIEWSRAWSEGRQPRFAGGVVRMVDFLLSAHITGLAVSMLLYANSRLAPIAFASAVAIGSKAVLRVGWNGSKRHFLNPSNFGITATLLLFPWVGIAPPYMFTENLSGAGDWILPAVIVVSGSLLNARYTKKIVLILAWGSGFAVQALLRAALFDMPWTAGLVPATGVAFLLFSFYMVSDPATTPRGRAGQVAFGVSVAAVYGLLMTSHVVFGFFFALTIVCCGRGLWLSVAALVQAPAVAEGAPAALPGRSAP